MFELFDHTADLGLRARAATLDELFSECARALFTVIVEDLDSVQATETRTVHIAGSDPEYLLFDWLTELMFIFESEGLLLAKFEVRRTGDGLTAVCEGESINPLKHRLEHEIKAITYHGLKVVADDGGWLAEVIIDI